MHSSTKGTQLTVPISFRSQLVDIPLTCESHKRYEYVMMATCTATLQKHLLISVSLKDRIPLALVASGFSEAQMSISPHETC